MWTLGGRAFALTIISVTVLAGGLVAAAPAAATAVGCPTGPPTVGRVLSGVAATSSGNAWAAGLQYDGTVDQTLAEHWNGTAWKVVSTPDPGGSTNPASLSGVAATSAANAWAAGGYCNGTAEVTLVERWNGSTWKQAASPSPGVASQLTAVAATSATSAWAVGDYETKSTTKTLTEQWNGTAWKQVPSPSPDASVKGGALLYGVAATSAKNAWAVGNYYDPTSQKTLTLILHWNGTAWKQVPSPSPGSVGLDFLSGVAATSTASAWAVGEYYNGSAYQTLVLRWNGTAWKQVPSPNPGGSSEGNSLSAVAATSANNAWADGIYVNSAGGGVTLILHWNGSAWTHVPSPTLGPPFPGDDLSGVAATSATNAWAAGDYCASRACPARKTLTERWNGSAWKHVLSP